MQFSYKLTPRIDLKEMVNVRFSAVSNIDDDNDAYQATNTSVSNFLQLTATSLLCQLNVEVFAIRFKISNQTQRNTMLDVNSSEIAIAGSNGTRIFHK
jgi:hypothetical protein